MKRFLGGSILCGLMLMLLLLTGCSGTGKQVKSTETVKEEKWELFDEGFERGLGSWVVASWDTPAKRVYLSPDNFSEGSHSLRCDFSTEDVEAKALFYREGLLNWEKIAFLKVDIYNGTASFIQTALYFLTPTIKWQESPEVPISPGWNKGVIFKLKEKNFKSEESNWTYFKPLEGAKEISRVGFLLRNIPNSGSVYIDNIQLSRK